MNMVTLLQPAKVGECCSSGQHLRCILSTDKRLIRLSFHPTVNQSNHPAHPTNLSPSSKSSRSSREATAQKKAALDEPLRVDYSQTTPETVAHEHWPCWACPLLWIYWPGWCAFQLLHVILNVCMLCARVFLLFVSEQSAGWRSRLWYPRLFIIAW